MKKGINIHRKEQWDLNCKPLICVHIKTTNATTRLFCLWLWGIEIGNFVLKGGSK